MGRKSTKENKNIYQLYREREELTREKASELLDVISADRIERIESEKLIPSPDDVIRMSKCYKAPELCNYYCSHQCPIGEKYVPPIEITELPNIILETVASLNSINPLTNRLIEISRDGQIADDEIPDFAIIQKKLEEVSIAVDSLNLWVDRTISEGNINVEMLNQYRDECNKKEKK